jgi:hypothetical protein
MERKGMVLESEIRTTAISEGYDPTAGIMHEGSARMAVATVSAGASRSI